MLWDECSALGTTQEVGHPYGFLIPNHLPKDLNIVIFRRSSIGKHQQHIGIPKPKPIKILQCNIKRVCCNHESCLLHES